MEENGRFCGAAKNTTRHDTAHDRYSDDKAMNITRNGNDKEEQWGQRAQYRTLHKSLQVG
jgi:hypothetical protein